jgi:hypothetical protein
VRKRFAITLAAGGRWPDGQTGGIGFAFNWVKVDNTGGSNPVSVGLNAGVQAGDVIDSLMTVSKAHVRVFNVAGPKNADGSNTEDWPNQVYLVSALGTTVILEVADHPIVDMVYAT